MSEFLTVEGKNYPSVIMGEDAFTGWFDGKFRFSEFERLKTYSQTLEQSYLMGVKGFVATNQETLKQSLIQFKNKNSDIICIANNHFRSHYYYKKESLWGNEHREKLIATMLSKLSDPIQVNWFNDIDTKNIYTKTEISRLYLNEIEYEKQVINCKDLCDFFVIGNLWYNSLFLLDRVDIISKEIEIVRSHGLVPVGIVECGTNVLNTLEALGIKVAWIWVNRFEAFPSLQKMLKTIQDSKTPLTAFRILKSSFQKLDIARSVDFIRNTNNIRSVLLGVDNKMQAKETFSICQQSDF